MRTSLVASRSDLGTTFSFARCVRQLRALARDYPVAVFVLVTFVLTWTIDFTLRATLGAQPTASNHDRWMAVLIPGIYGPSVGALVTTALRGGWGAVGLLVRRLLPWRVSLMWCLIAFALPILIDGIAVAIYAWRGGETGPFVAPPVLATLAYVAVKLTRGPLGEELGWRGFMLPALQTRYSALTSSLVVGIFWFLWHLPSIWMAGTFISGPSVSAYQLGWFAFVLICIAILMTWVVNHAGGSVVPAVLMHASLNTTLPLLFYPEMTGGAVRAVLYLGAIPAVCCAIAVTVRPRTPYI